jgi:uncharacterized RDD family membrane protein YckC
MYLIELNPIVEAVFVALAAIALYWFYLDYTEQTRLSTTYSTSNYKNPNKDLKVSNNAQLALASSMGQLGTEKDVVLHRILAVIIDYIVLGFSLLFIAGAWVYSWIAPTGLADFPPMAALGGLIMIIITLFLVIILWIPYAIILETWRGQTIGKMIMGIVVVKENGESCTFAAALLRNVLRIIDALPQSYLVGFIFMALSEKRQRIGDRLANTIVVRIKR